MILAFSAGVADASTVTGASLWHPALDPQVAWSNYSLNVVYDTYIPLLTYQHAGGRAGSKVVPGLAKSLPRITDHGRTYTLRLRQGLRYSNGEPVTASDFKFAVERLFRIGYGPDYFYDDIVGARRLERDAAAEISGIVTNDRTGKIVIHLVDPERSFTRKLAMTFVAPVPSSTPNRELFFHPPPATGPYVVTRSTRHGWTYGRNPEWRRHNHALMPGISSGRVGSISFKVIRSLPKAVEEVERGKIDWLSEALFGPEYERLRDRFPRRIRLEPTLSTEYFWLNTRRPPFDDVAVRRAINYAVDRRVFSQLSGGQIRPTDQILPPDLPGYKRFRLYPHDMRKARRLIAAANPSVRQIMLWSYNDRPSLMAGQETFYLGAVLSRLGFTVHEKRLSAEGYFSLIGNSRRRDLDAGVGNYYANYPDPDDFFRETLGAPVSRRYNENLAQFDLPSLTQEIYRLNSRPARSTAPVGYANLDRAYMRRAPWVPIGNVSVPLFVSKRIDLRKVISNPSFGVDLTSLSIKHPR